MSSQIINSSFSKRLNILSSVITDEKINKKVEAAFTHAKGDWRATMVELKKENINKATLTKIDFTHSLADITKDNEHLVSIITALPNITNMREFALTHNTEAIAHLVTDNSIPKEVEGANSNKKKIMLSDMNKNNKTTTTIID